MIAGKNQTTAQSFLLSQPGVAQVAISITGTLPAANRIQIQIQLPPGATA
jgi:hypothetical protein